MECRNVQWTFLSCNMNNINRHRYHNHTISRNNQNLLLLKHTFYLCHDDFILISIDFYFFVIGLFWVIETIFFFFCLFFWWCFCFSWTFILSLISKSYLQNLLKYVRCAFFIRVSGCLFLVYFLCLIFKCSQFILYRFLFPCFWRI